MKEKRIVTGLVLILAVSIFCFGMQKLQKQEAVQEEKPQSTQVVRIMSELENEIAYREFLESIAESNTMLPCNLEDMFVENVTEHAESVEAENLVGVELNEKAPEYTSLYPDLYVDKICPDTPEVEGKIAYLTFDDGPSKNTNKILDILKEKNAVATFFILGSTMTDDGEAALKRMTEQNCKIGIHTYSHNQKIIYASVKGFLDDFYKVYTQVYDITGEKVNIFRFPWGSYNSYSKPIKKSLVSEMERRGFTYFDWNVSAEDSVGHPTSGSIMKNILKDVKKYDQPVILMHDASVNNLTVQMLPKIIDKLVELGYSFGTLDNRKPCQFCW